MYFIFNKAAKSRDMNGKTYISYLITTNLPQKFETKHRYSEFESLHQILLKTFPSVVVPPIPNKHSPLAYASKPGKAQNDPGVIFKRKRLLQSFLNRVASHPILKNSHPFHVFLNGSRPWPEVVSNIQLSPLLKKKSSLISVALDNKVLKKPDHHFVGAKDYTRRFGNQIGYIRKIHKKIIGLYEDLTVSYTELGASYNGWSLTETALSEAIEEIGQSIDSTSAATSILFQTLEEKFGDLMSEYEKFSVQIQNVLVIRHQIHAEFEITSENLILKQQLLTRLETSEHESQRLTAILQVEGQPSIPISRPTGIMAQLNNLIDNNPDLTRRNQISKTKETIQDLEIAREETRLRLLEFNVKVQEDLDRFQRRKMKDLRDGMIGFCQVQQEFCKRGVDAWKGTRDVIRRIGLDTI
jgi:sorting nexin-4